MTQPPNPFGPDGWTPDRLPDLTGMVFVITGGNSGIGFETARALVQAGGEVIVLCRNVEKGRAALKRLRQTRENAQVDMVAMDLSDLASIQGAVQILRERLTKIDALINNAGLMMIPNRTLTRDGFETQFGVNHLGHFALNAALCDLVETAGGRFVCVTSIAAQFSKGLPFDDLMSEKSYSPTRAYANSKLANLIYAKELDNRLADEGLNARAYACHPGYSATNLQSTGPGALSAMLMRPFTKILSQPAEKGAIPSLLCAAGEEVEPGGFYGPTGFMEMTGPVGPAKLKPGSIAASAGFELWEASVKYTGADWAIFNESQT